MDTSASIRRFVKKSTIHFLVLGLICAAVFYFAAQQHYFSMVPIIFIYFYITSLISYFILVKSHELPTGKFYTRFLTVSSIKFLGSLAFVILFIIFSPDYIVPFLVIFITLYFISL